MCMCAQNTIDVYMRKVIEMPAENICHTGSHGFTPIEREEEGENERERERDADLITNYYGGTYDNDNDVMVLVI